MSVEKAAKGLIKGGQVTEGLLNKVEMAFRAYDPCLGCATHSLPGHLPLQVNIYDRRRQPGPAARPVLRGRPPGLPCRSIYFAAPAVQALLLFRAPIIPILTPLSRPLPLATPDATSHSAGRKEGSSKVH